MPYDYRKLTPEEREEVLRQRRERGYPLHSPPHPFRQAGHYLITAANLEHQPIMALPARRTDFETRLLTALENIRADINGWVILPNHYHALIGVESFDLVSAAFKQLHGATSREWNLTDGTTGSRRVWYRFTDQMIRDERHFHRALNYVHFNPVKHGYVTDPYEWPWLSLQNYVDSHGRDWLREKWKEYHPGDFGKGWDD